MTQTAPPTLDPTHDADLIKARQAVLEAQARAKVALEDVAAAEEAYTALLASKLNDPENGWRPRIWALEETTKAQAAKLAELEKLTGTKK